MKKNVIYRKVKIKKTKKKRFKNILISLGILLLIVASVIAFVLIRNNNKSALTGDVISTGENSIQESGKNDKTPIQDNLIQDNPIEKEPSKMIRKGEVTIMKIDG